MYWKNLFLMNLLEVRMEAIEQLERTAVSACCLTTRDEPMSRHTTFRIGGPADLFVVAHTYEACAQSVQEAGRLAYRL